MGIKRLRRAVGSLFALFCIAAFSIFLLTNCAAKPSSSAQNQDIADVYVQDKSVYYDGNYHGLDIFGLRDEDVVSYCDSEDDAFSLTKLVYKEIGVYTIYVKVERDGYNTLILSATISISMRVLDGISASDTVVEYDGQPHGIDINGVRVGDDVSYSVDGKSFSSSLELTEVGAYKVYFRVERDYAEYRGSCRLTILPSVSGKYFNAAHGVISISDFTTSNGEKVYYDLSRTGFIGDKPFSFDTASITVGGVKYEKITDGTLVYSLTVNGSIVAYFKEPTAAVSVAFDSGLAEVTLGAATFSFPDYNYCESINAFLNDGYSCGMSATVSSSDINITLSKRSVYELENTYLLCIYDGNEHTPEGDGLLFEADGAFVPSPPTFTEIGTYTVRTLAIRQGYLPAYGYAVLVIAPSPDGTYYSIDEKKIIRIRDGVAEINGTVATLTYSDGEWSVDGAAIASYSVLSENETLVVISVNGVAIDILENVSDELYYIGVVGDEARLLDEDQEPIYSTTLPSVFSSLSFNSVAQSSIPFPDYDYSFGVGYSDYQRADGVLILQFQCE